MMVTGHIGDLASSAGTMRSRRLDATSARHGERVIRVLLGLAAAFSVAVTTAIVVALLVPAVSFFREVPIGEFLTGTVWAPAFQPASFGVLPIVISTLMVVFFALLVGIPIGLGSAVYLAEYASERTRKIVKPVLEMLEGIPTVATGLFAFLFLVPLAQERLPFLDWQGPFSIGMAGIAVGLIIVPLIASVSDDAMRSVPAGLREGAYALGATKLKVSTRVVLPSAISGIVASFVLATSRAIGETMIVLIVAGAGNPNINLNPAQGAQTMTAYIGGTATGDIATGTVVYDTIFAVGTLLFLMTLVMNVLAIRLVRRFREVYE